MKTLRDYDMVLGTLRGDEIERSISILKPGAKIVSFVGPLDAAFSSTSTSTSASASASGLTFTMRFVFGLMRRKIMRLAAKREVSYSSLFVRPDGDQLSEIVILLSQERIRPVIDKVSPFGEAKEAIEYLVQGRSKGKIVVKMKNII